MLIQDGTLDHTMGNPGGGSLHIYFGRGEQLAPRNPHPYYIFSSVKKCTLSYTYLMKLTPIISKFTRKP